MTDTAISFARGVSQVRTPEHLVPLRDEVRTKHRAQLNTVFAALDNRFKQPTAAWMGCFRAAAEMAVMEQVGRQQLQPSDRRLLRQLWDALLTAN